MHQGWGSLRAVAAMMVLVARASGAESPLVDSRLEAEVLLAMSSRMLYGPGPRASAPMEDYRATRLQLSPGRALYASLDEFEFRHYSASKAAPPVRVAPGAACVRRLICHVDRHYPKLLKWQHYVQVAFPCWSLFRRFPTAQHYLDVHATRSPDGAAWQPWIAALNAQFARAGVRLLHDPNGTRFALGPPSGKQCDWIANATVKRDDFGWAEPKGDGPLHNFRYFMSRDDVADLQRHVLGRHYAPGARNVTARPRLVIVDRQGNPRHWVYAEAALARITAAWGHVLDAKLVRDLSAYAIEGQAQVMHNADIVISPHGAQLTNAVFVRPCTAVLELFPRYYYYPKKGPLAMEAGGIPYDGYHFDGSPRSETVPLMPPRPGDPKQQKAAGEAGRSRTTSALQHPIYASPESVLRALPDLLLDVIACRKRHALLAERERVRVPMTPVGDAARGSHQYHRSRTTIKVVIVGRDRTAPG